MNTSKIIDVNAPVTLQASKNKKHKYNHRNVKPQFKAILQKPYKQ